MPSCTIRLCRNHSCFQKKSTGITFHKFPVQMARKQSWVDVVRINRNDPNWMPSKFSVICSLHFEEDDTYLTQGGYRRIKKNAVPKLGIDCSRLPPTPQAVEYDEVPIEPEDGANGSQSPGQYTIVKVEPESDNEEDTNESLSASPAFEESEEAPDKRELSLARRLEAADRRVAQLTRSNQMLERRVQGLERKNEDLERNLQVLQKLNEGLAKRSLHLEQRNERMRLKISSLGIRDSRDDEDDEEVPPDTSRRSQETTENGSVVESDDDCSKRLRFTNASTDNPSEPYSDLLKITHETNIKVENVLPPKTTRKRQRRTKKLTQPSTSSEKPFDSPTGGSSSLREASAPSASPLTGSKPFDSSHGDSAGVVRPSDPLLIPVELIKTENEIKIEEDDMFQYTIESEQL